MKAYANVFPHTVDLRHEQDETPDQHHQVWDDAYRWCLENIGPHHKKFVFDMRGGSVPYNFSFKRPRDAMLFKLTWG